MKRKILYCFGTLSVFVTLSSLFIAMLLVSELPNRSEFVRKKVISLLKRPLPALNSHPLENSCKYPILKPDEESIKKFVTHPREVNCTKFMENFVIFDYDKSLLKIDQKLALKKLGVEILCFYRILGGTLKPNTTQINYLNNWTPLNKRNYAVVKNDQFAVKCHPANNVHNSVYEFAFAQVQKRPDILYRKNTRRRLSLDILVLDSTSLNMFRRHMPLSFDYMKNVMGFYHLEGYNKVADNSMVNLLPIFAGLRYQNATYGNHKLESDLPENDTLDLDRVPFIWNDFSKKNCPTMFNDDVMHHTRGIFHYPWKQAKGFVKKPTDYFFRPWHVWQRKFHLDLNNSGRFCFGNEPYHKLQLKLLEQMISVYSRNCHFSFSFITELPHDNPSNLELMDEDLLKLLKNLFNSGKLNNTALIIMGDHGHRVHQIMYNYIGRIEERMTFFSVYFPLRFRQLHPYIMRNLENNKNRLVSNYDIYSMLKDIVDERFNVTPRPSVKGISLFSPIPKNRTCFQANIPDNHCTCLEIERKLARGDELYKNCVEEIYIHVKDKLSKSPSCLAKFQKLKIRSMATYTTNQMIQHGVRAPTEEYLVRLERFLNGTIEYVEVDFLIMPWSKIEARIRLQHYKKTENVIVNSPIYFINFNTKICRSNAWRKNVNGCLCSFINN